MPVGPLGTVRAAAVSTAAVHAGGAAAGDHHSLGPAPPGTRASYLSGVGGTANDGKVLSELSRAGPATRRDGAAAPKAGYPIAVTGSDVQSVRTYRLVLLCVAGAAAERQNALT